MIFKEPLRTVKIVCQSTAKLKKIKLMLRAGAFKMKHYPVAIDVL